MQNLDTVLQGTKRELIKLKKEKEVFTELERKEENFNKIIESIEGLERTKRETNRKKRDSLDKYYDPGKYDTAFYYVKSIEENNIKRTENFNPGISEKCPDCGKEALALMSYSQTYDSPEGDTWEKEAFIIHCDKIHYLKKIARSNRFL